MKLAVRKERKLRAVFRTLIRKLKPRRTVLLHLVDRLESNDHGECEMSDKLAIVRVCRHRSYTEMLDTLLHEVAHAVTGIGKKHHGKRWGIAYAKAYRAIEAE